MPQRGGAGAAVEDRNPQTDHGHDAGWTGGAQLHTLLADLATLARNTIITAITPLHPLIVLTRPTPVQQKAFDLLGLTA